LVAVNFLYVLPDRSRFWAEAARVLAPGGRLVAAHTDRAGFGPVVREHVQADGVRGLLRPRLLAVGLFDLVIDAVQRHGRFQFSSFEELVAEASAAGLGEAEHLGRCYGGDEDGVNVLTRFSATSTPLRVPGTASPSPIPDDRLNQPTAASIT
jgi:SAM-dependent methyltransferase